MISYKITFSRSAFKEIESLDNQLVSKIIDKIENLESSPKPKGCIKIQGHHNLWRIRSGDYRIIYSVDSQNNIIDIIAVRHRKDAYRFN
jgi:mRNA interferase RelE/StbE